jgi:hypothetical protein
MAGNKGKLVQFGTVRMMDSKYYSRMTTQAIPQPYQAAPRTPIAMTRLVSLAKNLEMSTPAWAG